MTRIHMLLSALLVLVLSATTAGANTIRVKDLVEFDGVRGYSLGQGQ